MLENKEFINNKNNLQIFTFAQRAQSKNYEHLFGSLGFKNAFYFDSILSMVEKYILIRPELLIIDCINPVDKVFDCVKIFRSSEMMALHNAPILVLLSQVDENLLDNLVNLGANDSLVQPFIIADLREKIHNLVVSPQHYKSDSGKLQPVPHFTYNKVEIKAKSQELWVV